jgi:glycosyltransferase involved in cell wall biosynthesis
MERARAAAGPELAEHIHFVGEVSYAEIKTYYAGADLFVFPSYLESFGHPLLEAMASGLPTVAADIPCFREIGGDAVFYADPHKTDALAAAMEEALYVPQARETLIRRAGERVRDFGWDATAQRLSSLFDEVLAERASAPARLRAHRAA